MSVEHTPTVAILASGGGSTAEAFIKASQRNLVDAEVGLVVCNNPPDKAGVYDRVDQLNATYGLDIQVATINGKTHPGGKLDRGQTLEESEAIYDLVSDGRFTLVALMGYMKQINGVLMEEYGWRDEYSSIFQARMLNTHPGPLPETEDTWGVNASQRVLDLGLEASKHTVHVVAQGIDKGPIVAENRVPIEDGDTAQTLFERVQKFEKLCLPDAIQSFLKGQETYNND